MWRSAANAGYTASSDGSSWHLSCHPATVPSELITTAVICSPRSVTRSVPRTTATPAPVAASATVAHARSRNAGSAGGDSLPGHRYPGTKHSGKQMTSACCRPASATAAVANRTDSSGEAGARRFARAILAVVTEGACRAQSTAGWRSLYTAGDVYLRETIGLDRGVCAADRRDLAPLGGALGAAGRLSRRCGDGCAVSAGCGDEHAR